MFRLSIEPLKRMRAIHPSAWPCLLACALVFHASVQSLSAQAAGVPIENDESLIDDAPLVAKAEALKQAGKLWGVKQVKAALKTPRPAALSLPAASAKRLEPRDLAALGRKALVRVGWYYHEKETKEWHVNLADGYAITNDGAVATCHHCVDPAEQDITEGFLIASDASGNILAVTAVLARDKEMDAAIIRVEGGDLTPLPLNDQTAPGDSVFVFSDPLSITGYFTTGILNRFFWLDGKRAHDAAVIEGARNLRIHVSTDWAPGSSGAAILDACGNSIGHVAVIEPLVSEDEPPPPQEHAGKKTPKTETPAPQSDNNALIILHEAVPARGVKLLAESMKSAATKEP